MKLSVALLLVGLCSSFLQGAAFPSRSNVDCDQGEKQRFNPSTRYVYKYIGLTRTGIEGTSNDMAEIKIEAECEIVRSWCGFELKVSKISLLERSSLNNQFSIASKSTEFKNALELHSLTFTVVRGRISRIKAAQDEPVFVTNIKRGILSALQLEFKEEDEFDKDFVERDITGDCPTRYSLGNYHEEVTKVKNLMECANRSKVDSFLHPVMYTSDSTRKTLLNCSSSCDYILKGDEIESVECKETHLFRPFSKQSAGAMTTVTQKLTLLSANIFPFIPRIGDSDDSRKTSDLLFQFDTKSSSHGRPLVTKEMVFKTLNDLVTNNPHKETSWKAAVLYTQLVYQLQNLDYSQLDDIWRKYYLCEDRLWEPCQSKAADKEKQRQLLLDGVTQCGTEPCSSFVMDLIENPELIDWNQIAPANSEDNPFMKQLLNGMAYVRNPTESTVDSFMDLMQRKKDTLPKNSITVFGSMVQSHYQSKSPWTRDRSGSWVLSAKFKSWTKFLIDELKFNTKRDCQASTDMVDYIIFTLKGLQKISHLLPSSSKLVLTSCAVRSNYKNISISALQVLQDVQQDTETKNSLRNLYGDYEVDAEIRITAFLALMKTPSEIDIILALKTLEGEVNTQAGSFVWSWFNHMNNSVEPTHGKRISKTIKSVLRQREKEPRFFNSTSKSRFWEKSLFNENLNWGMATEGHVIYHPESFLPRSVFSNVTMDVLGGAFSLLEISGRQEGFEGLWGKLFGPGEYFPENHVRGLVKGREKRSVRDWIKVDYFDNKVNMAVKNPSGLFSMKLLGQELSLFTVKDIEKFENDIPLLDLVDELNDLKRGTEKIYSKNLMFAQESLVVPTSVGMPLKLSLDGTAAGSVHVNAQGDLRSLFWPWDTININLKGKVQPSAVVSMSGKMSVDAVHSSAGVQLNGTMFTSTIMQANMTYKEGQPLSINFNVTEKPQQIFNVSTAMIKRLNNEETRIEGLTKRNKPTQLCTSTIFNTTKFIGLDLCRNVSVPLNWYNTSAPLFPLTGTGNLSLTLHRTDPKLTTYTIQLHSRRLNEHLAKTLVNFSTPGATFERVVQFNLTSLNKSDDRQLNFSIGSIEKNWTTVEYQSASGSKKAAVDLNVTLWNNSLYHVTKVTNHTDSFVFLSNTTILSAKTAQPLTVVFLNTTYGYDSHFGNTTFNLTHYPANFTWKFESLYSKTSTAWASNVSCVMHCGSVPHSPLLNHNMNLNITLVNKTQEQQMQFNMTVNGTKKLLLVLSKKNLTTHDQQYRKWLSYFTNLTMFNHSTSLNLTMDEKTNIKWNHLNITSQNKSLTLNVTWFSFDAFKNMTINATYMNHSLLFTTTMKKQGDHAKSICWNGTYLNGTSWNSSLFNSCLAYVNMTHRKSFSWNMTAFNRTHKLNSTWLVRPSLSGILLNYTCQNTTLANATVWFTKTLKTKALDVNGTFGNWTLHLKHKYSSSNLFWAPYQTRTLAISHKIQNASLVVLNNTLTISFTNTSKTKSMSLEMVKWNETYGLRTFYANKSQGKIVWHVSRKKVYGPRTNISWDLVVKNTTDLFNFSSLVKYFDKKILNHSIVCVKRKTWNYVSVDLLPNITLTINGSRTLPDGTIKVNWTLYNSSILLNRLKNGYNGSISWTWNKDMKKIGVNFSLPNTSFYLTSLSLNRNHFNLSLLRKNGSEETRDILIRLLPNDQLHHEFNRTTLKILWKLLNNKTSNLPAKIVNITLNTTSGGINVTRTGYHLKMTLRNITKLITKWNFSRPNITDNLLNFSIALVNVTLTSLPNVKANYSFYVIKDSKIDIIKFLRNLSLALTNFTKESIETESIANEMIWNYKKIVNSFNLTVALFNNSFFNVSDGKAKFEKIKKLIIERAEAIGNWTTQTPNWPKDINAILKKFIPYIKNGTLYAMNETKKRVPLLHEITLTIRNMTYVSEYLINASYPTIYNTTRSVRKAIKKYTNNESFVGGMLYPTWLSLAEIYNISIFNATSQNINKYITNGIRIDTLLWVLSQQKESCYKFTTIETLDKHIESLLENVLPTCRQPRKPLEKIVEGFLNMSLAVYNTTVRLPSWYMKENHDAVVYLTNMLMTMLNDTVNVMNYTSNKTLPEIVSMYLNYTSILANSTWNSTKYLLFYSNWSKPLQHVWQKANMTKIYNSDALKALPWRRPLFRVWNSTAHFVIKLIKNITVETHIRKRVPGSIEWTKEKTKKFSNYIESCLDQNYPRLNITFNDTVGAASMVWPLKKRQMMFKAVESLSKLFSGLHVCNKKINFLDKARHHTNQSIIQFINNTEAAFNFSESITNGSLVDKLVQQLWKESWPEMMKFDIVESAYNALLKKVNKTKEEIYNVTKTPLYNARMSVQNIYQMESRDLANLFIPKNQSAFIINNDHVITFDKRSFQFPKNTKTGCTSSHQPHLHLITRDFLGHDFTVLGTRSKYIIITRSGQVVINKDGRIQAMDSQNTYRDLPLQFDDVYAIRDGPFIRVVHRQNWFEFEFEMDHWIFGAYISGFYHNRTMGFLGSNNGEVSDDWYSPLGKNTSRLEKFINSWLLGSDMHQCTLTTNEPESPPCMPTTKRCHQLFKLKDSSPFKTCFDAVDPKIYFQACLKDIQICDPSSSVIKTAHCSMSAAYVRACAREKITITMPSDCASCTKERYAKSSKDIDIVFVTSEGTNMKPIQPILRRFIQQLEGRLSETPFKPRYGLVGFSGNPPAHWKGHVHTLRGQFFGSYKDIWTGIDTLNFSPAYLKTNISDGYRGIVMATKYPFRPTAKKVLILLTDSTRVPDSQLTSEEVSKAIKDISAKLIVIGDYRFKKNMFGGDTYAVRYFKKQPQGVVYRNYERLPQGDDYVKVMDKYSGGAVFRLKKFESSSKLTFEIISNSILNLIRFDRCLKCKCFIDEFGKGRDICKETYSLKPCWYGGR